MKIYMSNIRQIKDIPNLENKLSKMEMVQYGKFSNQTRKLQYLLSHAIVKDICGENVVVDKDGRPTIKSGFVSIAHKDNIVIIAISNKRVGIDIENASLERDFIGESELLKLDKPTDKRNFYENFVKYESRIKFGDGAQNAKMSFYDMEQYLIGVCSDDADIKFVSFCAE